MNIREYILEGLPLPDDIKLYDCHGHLGKYGAFEMPNTTAEDILTSMDNLGINTITISANSSIRGGVKTGNGEVFQACASYPERMLGYITIHPAYAELIEDDVAKYIDDEGCAGFKLHPFYHGTLADDPRYAACFRLADDMKLPMLIHTWGEPDVKAAIVAARMYKNAQIIMAHTGATYSAMPMACEAMVSLPNLYGDLAVSYAYEGNVEWLCGMAGAKKILFGTDMPFYDPRLTVGRIALSDISEEEKLLIFGENYKGILDTAGIDIY